MSKFFLLLFLVCQIAVAGKGKDGKKPEESAARLIDCHVANGHLFCQQRNINEETYSQEHRIRLNSLPGINTPSSVVRIDEGEKPTFCVLDSKLGAKGVIATVLNSQVTDCNSAQLLTTDQESSQCELMSLTIAGGEIEPLFNGELLREEDINKSQVNYLCDNCAKNFQTSEACNEHRIKCGKSDNTRSGDNQPHKNKPDNACQRKKVACIAPGCDKVFTTNSHMKTHHKVAHEGKRYPCDICDKSFTSMAHMKRHKISLHQGGCSECGKFFAHVTDLRAHKKNEHQGERHTCAEPKCNRSFASVAALKAHCENIHQGKRYACAKPGCDEEFTTKGNLKEHLRSVHNRTRYACKAPGCKKSYSRKYTLEKHQKECH